MKIENLFNELKIITANKEGAFAESGMVNWFDKMQYGFFPLGLGILDENNKKGGAPPTSEIEQSDVMILGNDFGTVSYIENDCGEIGEISSKTANNLLAEIVGLDPSRTFFTNFYLGVRTHPCATMTGRVEKLSDTYKSVCFEFFKKQLELVKPRLVICLGHDVKDALAGMENSFVDWSPKSISIKKIYECEKHIINIDKSKDQRFVLIPHPCDLRNFTKAHREKLNGILINHRFDNF